jgi:hypothetical protein
MLSFYYKRAEKRPAGAYKTSSLKPKEEFDILYTHVSPDW